MRIWKNIKRWFNGEDLAEQRRANLDKLSDGLDKLDRGCADLQRRIARFDTKFAEVTAMERHYRARYAR